MANLYFPLLIILVLLAIVIPEPIFAWLVYFLIGVFLSGRWLARRSMAQFAFDRKFTARAFPGEKVEVELNVSNQGWLPILWLQLAEALPVDLVGSKTFRQVTSLPPNGGVSYSYMLFPKRRGYYRFGPLQVQSGDLLGLTRVLSVGQPDYLTVYPEIVLLHPIKIPSYAPMGTLRSQRILSEDPARIFGKRDYVVGDSPRKIDWKASASAGTLQVKKLESSTALDTAIFLDFYREHYHYRRRIEATELAVVTAASLANWLIANRQQVSFFTNGQDSYQEKDDLFSSNGSIGDTSMVAGTGWQNDVRFGKGNAHLMQILESLGRVDLGDEDSFLQLFRQKRVHLSWGTSVIVITGHPADDLFEELFIARRSGLNAMVVLCGVVPDMGAIQARGAAYGIPIKHLMDEQDLRAWQ